MMVTDANVLVAVALPGDDSARAEALWDAMLLSGETCLVPAFGPAEVISSIRQMARGGRITPEAEERAIDDFIRIIRPTLLIVDSAPLTRAAWELARELNERHTYDCVYLAVARAFNTEFWTADQRLLRRLAGRVPQARFLGDYPLEE